MNHILFLTNTNKVSSATLDFACKIAAIIKAKLSVGMIEEPEFQFAADPQSGIPFALSSGTRSKASEIASGTNTIMETCRLHGISPDITVYKETSIPDIIFESRFTDMIIIEPGLSFDDKNGKIPSAFAREIIAGSECPTLLTPHAYQETKEIIFCFDGSSSAMFAIKQFTQLFPIFNHLNVVLLEVKNREEPIHGTEKVIEWLEQHYEHVSFVQLKGDPSESLFKYLFVKENKFVVIGAYGRRWLSRLFRKSTAEVLVHSVNLPIFIAHY